MDLSQAKIDPSERRQRKASADEVQEWLDQLPSWELEVQDGVERMVKTYHLAGYTKVIAMVNAIAQWADQANHHPSMVVDYKTLKVSWWSHDVGGLHLHDAIAAANCDRIFLQLDG